MVRSFKLAKMHYITRQNGFYILKNVKTVTYTPKVRVEGPEIDAIDSVIQNS